jgi:hypothetical protein
VDATYRRQPADMSDETKKLFKAFDDTRELVSRARAGDHGRYLIAAAETSNKLTGIEIKRQNLGTNPVCTDPIQPR